MDIGNLILWAVQLLLGVAFLAAGVMKLTQSFETIREKLGGWADDIGPTGVKLIGAVELLGALGLVLPMLTGILPILTPIAAIGLGIVMVGAAATHLRRSEMGAIAPNMVLLALTLVVAVGRLALVPVAGVA